MLFLQSWWTPPALSLDPSSSLSLFPLLEVSYLTSTLTDCLFLPWNISNWSADLMDTLRLIPEDEQHRSAWRTSSWFPANAVCESAENCVAGREMMINKDVCCRVESVVLMNKSISISSETMILKQITCILTKMESWPQSKQSCFLDQMEKFRLWWSNWWNTDTRAEAVFVWWYGNFHLTE